MKKSKCFFKKIFFSPTIKNNPFPPPSIASYTTHHLCVVTVPPLVPPFDPHQTIAAFFWPLYGPPSPVNDSICCCG